MLKSRLGCPIHSSRNQEFVDTHRKVILIVEDSPQDYEVTVRALRDAGVQHDVVHCDDGDEAIEFLEGIATTQGEYPCLILLDLNLPGSSGHDVLLAIRASDAFQHIPVVVLTTSAAPRDIGASYKLGANSYVQKPVNLAVFRQSMSQLAKYWFETVMLPLDGEIPGER